MESSKKLESTTERVIEGAFGPRLPPHLLEKKQSGYDSEKRIYGPILPDNLRINDNNSEKDQSDSEDMSPSTSESIQTVVIGPEIPTYLKSQFQTTVRENEERNLENLAEDCYGPCPTLMISDSSCSNYKTFEKKKIEKAPEQTKEKRESWMLVPPENKTGNFMLGARKFRKYLPTEKESDQSIWTETPQSKMEGKNIKKERDHSDFLRAKMLEERNKEMDALVKKSSKSKRRKIESLVEIHIKKMKKKKKKEAAKEEKNKKPERRPFDRNIDLQVHRIDKTQRKSIMDKAMFLNSRFSAGESKYL